MKLNGVELPANRTELGHDYIMIGELGCWFNLKGNPVQVFPPCGTRTRWHVVDSLNRIAITVDEPPAQAEAKSFQLAAGFINLTLPLRRS